MHQMCSCGIVIVAAASIGAAVEGCRPRSGAKADYTIQQQAESLQESLAVEKALQTLVRFFPTNRWEVQAYSQTTAPDKSPDKNFLRNRKNANRGTVHFLDRQARIDKVVAVELFATNLSCEVLRSK